MVFSSPVFLYVFLPIVVLFYAVTHPRGRNALLLAASLTFYYWGSGRLLWLLLASITVNYSCGLLIGGARQDRSRRLFLTFGVAANLGLLFYFKYLGFLLDELDVLACSAGWGRITRPHIILPIGISFFTFQALSYLIDLAAGKTAVQRNPIDFALYIALFPQLIAGPIVRYVHIAGQIRARAWSNDNVYEGLARFVRGLAKKVLLADTLSPLADALLAVPAPEITFAGSWLGAICFTLQIYYDFAGYSDMAIGLGRIFGFRLRENFNFPYIARSVTEFWRRWHISLSTWFRDYVYIPIGGNRRGIARTYFNLLVVFVLCGLWHGANWNFLFWGLYHGLFLVFERIFLRTRRHRTPRVAMHLYTLLVVCVGWVFFRVQDIGLALRIAASMFRPAPNLPAPEILAMLNPETALYLFAGILCATPLPGRLAHAWAGSAGGRRHAVLRESLGALGLIALLLYAATIHATSDYAPFIYFQF